jgi:hypothetical protein
MMIIKESENNNSWPVASKFFATLQKPATNELAKATTACLAAILPTQTCLTIFAHALLTNCLQSSVAGTESPIGICFGRSHSAVLSFPTTLIGYHHFLCSELINELPR